jgi:hypothetical protein
VQYREYPVENHLPKYKREASDAEALQTLRNYTHVLVWDWDDVLERRLAEAGFREIHRRGSFRLFHRDDGTGD